MNDPRLTLLLILDGFGLADFNNRGNAITPETAPHIFGYMKQYPSTTLITHGKDVGLFKNQAGNSEAGHLNIGAGRVVKQDLVRISDAISDGTFFKNEAFDQALYHAKKHTSAVHVMGLLTDGQSAHAHPEHLYALLDYFWRNNQQKVYLHLFTDGRDSPPHSAIEHLVELRKRMKHGEKIATITGRFYGMDRNKTWERTQSAYRAIVEGRGNCTAPNAEEAISQAYNRRETDEYICPTVIIESDKPVARVSDNDVVYFFNARSDRARQITKAFVQRDFSKQNAGAFTRKNVPKDIRFVAMADFGPDLEGILTAFPSPDIHGTLAEVIGNAYRQLYITESEKFSHITYFINGGHAASLNGEYREYIQSPAVYSYADQPAMKCAELTRLIIGYIKKKRYDFMCVNFPNADMVGHTGNFRAAQKAVTILDAHIQKIVNAVLKKNGQIMIVADHGNAEEMINLKTDEMMTEHTANPVPCVIISKNHIRTTLKSGRLADVAPTLLQLMKIKKPKEMTGKSLFLIYIFLCLVQNL